MTQNLIDAAEKERALEFARLARKDLGEIKHDSALDWAIQSLTIVMAKTGDLIGVKEFADEITYQGSKIAALTIIAEIQADQGDQPGAQKILAEARELAEKLPKEKAYWMDAVGSAQVQLGDIAAARATLDHIEQEWARVSLLVTIAKAQWHAKDRMGAMASYSAAREALKGKDAYVADYLLIRIVESAVWTGDYAWGRETIEQVKDPIKQAKGLFAIGRAQAHSGDKAGAIATLMQAWETLSGAAAERWKKKWCVNVLTDIESALRELGEVKTADELLGEALSIATMIDSANEARSLALAEVALAQKAAGGETWKETMQQAWQAVEAVGKQEDRVALTWRIACRCVGDEEVAVAQEWVARAVNEKVAGSDPWWIGFVARQLAWEGVKADLTWIDRLRTGEERALANSGAAVGMIGA